MTTCFESRDLEEIEALHTKDEDVDLESLLQQSECENDESSQTDLSSSSGGGEDVLVLHGSNESLASVDEEVINNPPKPKFFEKSFLKSLPVAILTKRKFLGSNSSLPCSALNSPTPRSLPGTPRSSRPSVSLTHRKLDRTTSCKIHIPKQMLWNIWVSDLGEWKEIEIAPSSTSALLLHKLLSKLNRNPDLTQWSIIEQNSETLIERFVEDYELMDDILTHQDSDQISRFCLNRTPAKYSILQHPEYCLPPDMLTFPSNSPSVEDLPDSVKRLQMQNILTRTASEMSGWLHVRDVGKRSWKKLFCILRNSGLYYSNKNNSKDPQHLVCLAEVHSARVWFPINAKKQFNNSPTTYCFCLKPRVFKHGSIIRWFCAETNHQRSAWINGLRLTMNGSRFHEAYLSARKNGSSSLVRSSSDRAINKYDGNFVAMDFSGSTGRVIHDPMEVAMVELEQQSSWRRRIINRTINNSSGMDRGYLGSSAPTKDVAYFTRAIHLAQPWYYGKISREEATEEMQRKGNLEGTFLLRESHSIPGGIVITICHNQKSRHIPVPQVEKDGQSFYSSDNGETRFLDLIQFVDFHRLNKGSLPCLLLHECTRSYA